MTTPDWIKDLTSEELKTLVREVEEVKLTGQLTDKIRQILNTHYNKHSYKIALDNLLLDIYKEITNQYIND